MAKLPTQPSREGLVAMTLWVRPEVVKAVKQIALETDTTVKDLMNEQIDSLLAIHRKKT